MLLRHVARPMLAAWFIYDGYQAVRNPQDHIDAARRGVALTTSRLTGDESPQPGADVTDGQLTTLIRAHAVATMAAASLLAVGKAPRASSWTLAALTVPLAVANEPFTSSEIPRDERTRRFITNIGAVGAALIAGADLEGRPGIQWRINQARSAKVGARAAKEAAKEGSAKQLASHARASVTEAQKLSRRAARKAAKRTAKVAHRASRRAARNAAVMAHSARHAAHTAHHTATATADAARAGIHQAGERIASERNSTARGAVAA